MVVIKSLIDTITNPAKPPLIVAFFYGFVVFGDKDGSLNNQSAHTTQLLFSDKALY